MANSDDKTWYPLKVGVAKGDSILGVSFLRSAYMFVDLDNRRVYLGQARAGVSDDLRNVPFQDAAEEQTYFSPGLDAGLPRKLAQQQDAIAEEDTVSISWSTVGPDATVTVADHDSSTTKEVVFDGTSVVETRTLPPVPTSTNLATRTYAGVWTAVMVGLSMMTLIVGL